MTRKLFDGKKAQTIATEQIINISKLSFEAAKIPNLSCSLSSGGSAWAPKGMEQIFSTWWSHWASGMAEEQVECWTLPSPSPPLACPLPSVCLCDRECVNQFREFTPTAPRQLPICSALQSSAKTVQTGGTGTSIMSGKLFSLTHFL